MAVAFCLGIAGFLNAAGRGPVLLGLAVALGSLAGLELSLREHLAGFRSHSTVLAGCVSAVCIAATVLVFGTSSAARAGAVGLGICAFCAAFWAFRRLYSSRRARVRVR